MPAEVVVYRSVGGVELDAHVVTPEVMDGPRPAAVFFHGGGFRTGKPDEFLPQCEFLANRGMVAVTVRYRLVSGQASNVIDCVADAQAALRWVRTRPDVDPTRVVAVGFSAGGLLAWSTVQVEPIEPSGDPCRADALILINGIRTSYRSFDRTLTAIEDAVPEVPPTLILHGTRDGYTPIEDVRAFASAMADAGRRCDLVEVDGTHTVFATWRGSSGSFAVQLANVDAFLVSLGFLHEVPDIDTRIQEVIAAIDGSKAARSRARRREAYRASRGQRAE